MKEGLRIINPLQMNDWEIKIFLQLILGIQLAMWGLIGVDAIGLEIPILRQLICFIYLTFVPGITILRILKLHKLGNIETSLYTIGLSIATLMLVGSFMNAVYPIFGISEPISLTPLTITISVVVLMLCVLSYIKDKNFSDPSYIDIKEVLTPPILFLSLLPFLAVLGTYLVNFYRNNIILMVLISIIALIVILIAFDKFIPEKLYALAIFTIALSLVYHMSLISMYISGCDIHHEVMLSKFVIRDSLWYPTLYANCNAMLSIVILPPIYSIISNMSIMWVYKIIFPSFCALIPLGLYRIFQRETNDEITFLSCFFFISTFLFYLTLTQNARQAIAEFFIVLIVLLIIDRDMSSMEKKLLAIIFVFCLVVSHYGTSYIFMFLLIFAVGLLFLPVWNQKQQKRNTLLTPGFITFYVIVALAWYIYISSSSVFTSILNIGDHIASSIFTEFANPEAAQGLHLVRYETVSQLHELSKYFHLVSQFFIGLGLVTVLWNRRKMKFEDVYIAFSMVAFAICVMCLLVPYFGSAMNTIRIYHITLIFLAPFCIVGGMTAFKMLNKVVRLSLEAIQQFEIGRKRKANRDTNPKMGGFFSCDNNFGASSQAGKNNTLPLRAIAVFCAIFLLLNTGFIYEVAKDNPSSKALSSYIDSDCYNEKEAVGGQWLSRFATKNYKVYVDANARFIIYDCRQSHTRHAYRLPLDVKQMLKDAYIYLRTWNIEHNELFVHRQYKATVQSSYLNPENFPELYGLIGNSSKIYDNNGAQIFVGAVR